MISLSLAKQLKAAGLVWKTSVNDFFGIPDRGFDNHIFVLSDLQANMDLFRGWPVVTFHGTAEWAMDYILTSETVWMPTEEQLRETIAEMLLGEEEINLQLNYTTQGYQCRTTYQGESLTFTAIDASEAYGLALLHLLLKIDT
ncbi:MAG: pilus assembly protein CpaE [Anaerolineae bacterium]